jgi:pimeloyl-ACP methyl ester carboxylesterase
VVGAGAVALFVWLSRIAAREVLRPGRWKPEELWPGVPFPNGAVRAADFPVAHCATVDGLRVVGPWPHAIGGDASLGVLQTDDLIVRIDGVSTQPPEAERLFATVHRKPAGATAALEILRRRPDNGAVDRLMVTAALPPVALTPHDLGLGYEDVALTADDGRTLRGWFIPGPTGVDRAIIYLHGLHTNRRRFGLSELALRAHRRGYHLLLIDLFGSGESGGEYVDFWGSEEARLAADHLIGETGIARRRIALVGCSFGAYKALLAAGATGSAFGAVAAVSPGGTTPRDIRMVEPPPELPGYLRRRLLAGVRVPRPFLALGRPLVYTWIARQTGKRFAEVDPVAAAGRVRCPVLIVHGTADTFFPPAFAAAVCAALPGPKALTWLDGHDHFTVIQAGESLWQPVFAFFDAHLPSFTHARNGHRPTLVGTRAHEIVG